MIKLLKFLSSENRRNFLAFPVDGSIWGKTYAAWKPFKWKKRRSTIFVLAPISLGYERVEISWYHLFALPNTKLFYFRARVHHFWWLLIFDSFLTLDTGKLKRIQTSEKSFCKILLAVLPASKRPDISAPLHNSSVHFHLHNCSLKILDDCLTSNACLFPPT